MHLALPRDARVAGQRASVDDTSGEDEEATEQQEEDEEEAEEEKEEDEGRSGVFKSRKNCLQREYHPSTHLDGNHARTRSSATL